MKEIIVIFATVILGIAIAGFVLDLKSTAQDVTTDINTKVSTFIEGSTI